MYAIKMTFTNVRMTFRVPRDTIAGPAPLLYFFLFHTRRIARIDTYFTKNLSSRFTPKINYMRLNRLDLVPSFHGSTSIDYDPICELGFWLKLTNDYIEEKKCVAKEGTRDCCIM